MIWLVCKHVILTLAYERSSALYSRVIGRKFWQQLFLALVGIIGGSQVLKEKGY